MYPVWTAATTSVLSVLITISRSSHLAPRPNSSTAWTTACSSLKVMCFSRWRFGKAYGGIGRLSRFAQVTPGTFRTAGVRPNVYSRPRRRSQIKYAWPSGEKGEPPMHVRQRRASDTTSAVRRGAHGGPDALGEYPAVR